MIRGDADMEEKFHYVCRNPWDPASFQYSENYPWLWTPDLTGSASVPRRSRQRPRCEIVCGSCRAGRAAERPGGRAPHSEEQIAIDIAFRVIADHIRTLSFAIADGIQPATRTATMFCAASCAARCAMAVRLAFTSRFFYKLVDVLADTMGDVFPEIRAKKEHVQEIIRAEEEAFNKTLDRGNSKFLKKTA